jgi:glycosyltransferase involved in cell wall biosynthesis
MSNIKQAVFILPAINGGGAERVVLNLYQALEQHCNYQCHIVSLTQESEFDITGFRVHFIEGLERISKKGFHRLSYRKNMSVLVDNYIQSKIGSNVLALSNMMFADKVMSESKLNVYHVIHSEYGHAVLSGKSFFKRIAAKRNIEKIYNTHPLIFISEGVKKSFVDNFNCSVKKSTIYNPINIREVHSLANEKRVEIGEEYIIHVGRFNRVKRHDRLLEEFSKVNSNVKLLLLGGGKLEAQIRSKIKSLQLENRVIVLGFQKNPYPYIKYSKGLILTSDSEGLPMVLLEAMALGIPIATTDCSNGIREAIGHDHPGLIAMDNIQSISTVIDSMLTNPEDYITPLKMDFNSSNAANKYASLDISK